MTHALKTWPEYFKEVSSGNKKFEVRKNDRPFKVGDTLILQEYDPQSKQYTGNELTFKIAYILNGPGMGIYKDFCVMSLADGISEVEYEE